jgi:glycerol-3-phosphate dehydrogenase
MANGISIAVAGASDVRGMQRELPALADSVYDLLVVGGGIQGACVAWDAAARGLSVALVEKGDFCSATSANSLKIIHGGLRYLQHADFKRVRESMRERACLMRIAPHLVHPLPVLIPTYGHMTRGRGVLALALIVNDLIALDCNRLGDPQKCIPRGHLISRDECLRLLAGIHRQDLTGGAIFYDAQVYNSERLVLAFLHSAERAGTKLANYVEVTGFLREGDCVIGVDATDLLTGDRFDIRARTVVSTCGPWANRVLGRLTGHRVQHGVCFAKAFNLVTQPLFHTYAVGIPGENGSGNAGALGNGGSRFLFVAPWRGRSLIGTAYAAYDEDPDDFRVTENDVRTFLEDINRAYPPANLSAEAVALAHGGLVPISGVDRRTGRVQLATCYQIHDFRDHGVKGMVSVVGVKYTTARHVAQKVVDRVFELWECKPPKSASALIPLHGGEIEQFEAFLRTQISKRPCGLGEEAIRRLVYNYGSAYPAVLQYLDRHAERCREDVLEVLQAEVLHGIREEMAQKLSDIVFRRTELGTAGHPGDQALRFCADIMAAELGWSPSQTQREMREVAEMFTVGGRP